MKEFYLSRAQIDFSSISIYRLGTLFSSVKLSLRLLAKARNEEDFAYAEGCFFGSVYVLSMVYFDDSYTLMRFKLDFKRLYEIAHARYLSA